jgi:UDP-N-acetylmuramoyl-tripeptide--D-alanyl-D-alanine ligase
LAADVCTNIQIMAEIPSHLTLGELQRYVQLSGLGRLLVPAEPPDWQAPIGAATNDSRNVEPGSLFVALQGEQADGHIYVPGAVERGAGALIVQHLPTTVDLASRHPTPIAWLAPEPLRALQLFAAWWRAQFPGLQVVGITGSVGKTTAKNLSTAALRTLMPVLASPRSFNNEIGLPLTLLSLGAAHCVAVLEMGIYDVGDIAFLARIARQQIAIVLNVEVVHVERAGSIERVAQAKQEIVETLPLGGVSILNRDDPRVWAMRAAGPGLLRSFGLQQEADWRGMDIEALPEGLRMTLVHEGRAYPIRTALPGRHHAYALLATAALLEVLGVSPMEIVPALEAIPAESARQQMRRGPGNRLIIDDSYNASPPSMRAALDLLASQAGPRRVAILADMLELGPTSPQDHAAIGAYARQTADLVLAVGPLAQDIAAAAGPSARWYPDKAALYAELGALLELDDVVLVKGSRGMKMEDVVAWLHTTR